MSKNVVIHLVAAFGLLAGPTAYAETSWYTIELIVFQDLRADGLHAEGWPTEPDRPTEARYVELTSSSDLALDEDDDALGSTPFGFRLLDTSAFRLTEIASRLRHSQRYRPLLHIAWRQPGFTRADSRTVRIHSELPERLGTDSIGSLNLAIDGTVRLFRGRYLHVEVDLLHYRPEGSVVTAGGSGSAPATLFRLTQSRRMRSRELHYFDHPLFGVIMVATPFEQPAPPLGAEDLEQE